MTVQGRGVTAQGRSLGARGLSVNVTPEARSWRSNGAWQSPAGAAADSAHRRRAGAASREIYFDPGRPSLAERKCPAMSRVIENDKRPLGATAETFCEKGNKAKQNTYYQLNPRSFIRDPNYGRGCLTAAPLVIGLKARMPFSSSPRGARLGRTPTFLPVLLIGSD